MGEGEEDRPKGREIWGLQQRCHNNRLLTKMPIWFSLHTDIAFLVSPIGLFDIWVRDLSVFRSHRQKRRH